MKEVKEIGLADFYKATNTPVKISIIVNTYNRAEILKTRSLPSALQQLCKDSFEIIVVDDCSSDTTEEVVKEFQTKHPNLHYCRHEENLGLAASRNTGASLARGQYILFLDDDDWIIPYTIEIGTLILDNFSEYKVVIGGRLVINPEGAQYQPPPKVDLNSLYTTLDDGFVMRKEVFNDIQYDENLLTNEDADFGIQFMKEYGYKSIFAINNCLLVKHGHEVGSATSWSSPSKRTFEGMERYMKKNLPFYEENYQKSKNSDDLEYILRYMGRLYCQGGEMKKGIPYLWKAVKLRPMHKNIPLLLAGFLGHKFFTWFWKRAIISVRTKTI